MLLLFRLKVLIVENCFDGTRAVAEEVLFGRSKSVVARVLRTKRVSLETASGAEGRVSLLVEARVSVVVVEAYLGKDAVPILGPFAQQRLS